MDDVRGDSIADSHLAAGGDPVDTREGRVTEDVRIEIVPAETLQVLQKVAPFDKQATENPRKGMSHADALQQAIDFTAGELFRASVDWRFFLENCMTHDPHAKENKVQPFPIHKRYIQELMKVLTTNWRVAIYKSRQMLVTWTIVAYTLRECLFIPGSYIAYISKKEEDAGKLIERAKFIYDRLPENWRKGLPKVGLYYAKKHVPVKMILSFSDGRPNSVIQAYPQGGDQVRMETFSHAYWDECGFCDNQEAYATYAALKPTVEGGGQIILCSTPPRDPEHWWEKFVTGRLFGARSDY